MSLSDFANIAQIATAVVAVLAYGRYQLGLWRKRRALEAFLQAEFPGRRDSGDQGRRTVLHLMSALGMSEEDVLKAAFGNKRIKCSTAADPETKRAAALYMQFKRPESN